MEPQTPRSARPGRDRSYCALQLSRTRGAQQVVALCQDSQPEAGARPPGRSVLFRYIRALDALGKRVPIAEAQVRVAFTWADAFDKSKRATNASAGFEKACAVHALGALLSQEAGGCDMASHDGLKEAFTLYNQAAGAFGALGVADMARDLAAAELTPDLTPDAILFARVLMEAQAQQCFYIRARMQGVSSGVSSGVLAKLAQGAADCYGQACLEPCSFRVICAGVASGCMPRGVVSNEPRASALSVRAVDAAPWRCSQAARVAGKFVRDKTYVPRLLCSLQYYRAEAQHRLSLEALARVLKNTPRVSSRVRSNWSGREVALPVRLRTGIGESRTNRFGAVLTSPLSRLAARRPWSSSR